MIKTAIMLPIITLLLVSNAMASPHPTVEIFDVTQGKVIQTMESNQAIQTEAAAYLKHITSIYTKLNPFPDKGYMIRIPLQPFVRIQNQWLQGFVTEIIVIFPQYEQPYLMVFDDQDNPHFFNFERSTELLLQQLRFQPNRYTQLPL